MMPCQESSRKRGSVGSCSHHGSWSVVQWKDSDFLNGLEDFNNIKFTYEVEQDGQLPFLDLLLNGTENGDLKLQIYRKPTYTDQYLNFSSHHPTECGENFVGKKSVPCYRQWR